MPGRFYLLEGQPGAGKTTLALQFLLEGVKAGEQCMFVTLSETSDELSATAASHGWNLDGVHIMELIASEESLIPDARYTMFHPSEVELTETTKSVVETAKRIRPSRVVFDSLSELRLLADNPLRYRRQILALKQQFVRLGCTVLVLDDKTHTAHDMHLHSIAHGVIVLEVATAEYGVLRRQLQVKKLRGTAYREGFHDFIIRRGGLTIFPRLVASEHRVPYAADVIKSGIDQLDELLGGGLTKGTSTLIIGPAGSGKSSLATQYVTTAAEHGERSSMFVFDESIATLLERSAGLKMPLSALMDDGLVQVRQVDPAELSPGEFTHAVRKAVEEGGARLVVIDSLTGFLNAMPSERFLTLHLHELLTYLAQRGVTTILLVTQHGIVNAAGTPAVDASYLSDTVLLLRYFEALGEIRQAVSVIKKRTGRHQRSVRELTFNGGLSVGPPIVDFHGVLSGMPHYVGRNGAQLLSQETSDDRE